MKRSLALLLGALLLSAAAARETDWCKKQRKQCEAGCPKSARVQFDCKDEDGARSVACSCISADGHTLSSSTSSSNGGGGSTTIRSSSSSSSSASSGDSLSSFVSAFAGWPWGGEEDADEEKPAADKFQAS
ncbi:hypothetical protein C2E21_5049 [Chlorella sorokiniana]|uniref:Uncharacterized protein n=1 Tax=Chlorella sorokiniana TaxID=3076 RepID=A0A2P6TQJ1_CHLSO|nr:hypothetical protein C2E21_5049 [Chlorella sorokiniana]|eukprot:PRW56305.1 hypothetical protein C2E21_5049 [Chlorella sorokiniana]